MYEVMLFFLCLQAESERDDEVQTAFLDWLHAQSHQPLSCLTARSNIILLPCAEGVEKSLWWFVSQNLKYNWFTMD